MSKKLSAVTDREHKTICYKQLHEIHRLLWSEEKSPEANKPTDGVLSSSSLLSSGSEGKKELNLGPQGPPRLSEGGKMERETQKVVVGQNQAPSTSTPGGEVETESERKKLVELLEQFKDEKLTRPLV